VYPFEKVVGPSRTGARAVFSMALALAMLTAPLSGQSPSTAETERPARVSCAACIRANMEFLASDALRGLGSGTEDELLAATYVASELERAGVAPAGGTGAVPADLSAYLQPVTVLRRVVTGPTQLSFSAGSRMLKLTEGTDFYAFRLAAPEMTGTLHTIRTEGKIASGDNSAFVLLPLEEGVQQEQIRSEVERWKGKAAALLLPISGRIRERVRSGSVVPSLPARIEGVDPQGGQHPMVIYLEPAALEQLRSFPEGASVSLRAEAEEQRVQTHNVIGVLRGSDPRLSQQAILLSAHLDHLGTGRPVNGDAIYNGADDDASGVTAVLELARALAGGPRPRRTVIFALFGSEEEGLWGATYYREHPTVPLASIIANLEFEMLARRDMAVGEHDLWLTGWDRSNLGPELARHGARLVGDPHPEEHFFERSDNYALAQRGVVAHTISSYGLHSDYHQPSDDLSRVDWDHLIGSIESLIAPIAWLANSEFRPQWLTGKKP
jgi:aminopeptidase YwaD